MMSKNKECEERIMLNEEEYKKIFPIFEHENQFIQTNEYYDLENLFLNKNHMVLRIRKINNGDNELTLKIKGNDFDLEYNQNLSLEEANNLNFEIINKEICDELKKQKINLLDLRKVGYIKTYRLEKKFEDYLLVLDKNEYGNIIDYNLEVESLSKANALDNILKYCEKYNLKYSNNYKSKSRRAIEYFQKQKK